ncbi:tetratricopeptide repeat protein [Aliikangiella coralliicola]|uniref:Uncharacterized protein n=1 Tax=Aliikangiella coralliicola TaxID=2592383 RepID=A0A545UGF4_9GAMM|nr:hypothetical protein [Aliikangiella coralliicola]TQV88537.1 hypothetical protein FLL46_08435 [Aliikangiella coralliicola]
MSVVNEMLRELQDSQPVKQQLNFQPVAKKFSLSPIVTGLFIGVGILILAWYFFSMDGTASNKLDGNQAKQLVAHEQSNTKPGVNKIKSENTAEKQSALKPIVKEIVSKSKKTIVASKEKATGQLEENKKVSFSKRQILKEESKKAPLIQSEIKTKSLATQLNEKLRSIQSEKKLFGAEHAITKLKVLVQQNPRFDPARLQLIKTAWESKHPELSSFLQRAVKESPSQPAFRIAAARYFVEQNDLATAESFLLDLSQLNEVQPSLLQTRAIIRQKQSRHQLAIQDYGRILGISPNRGDIYIALGISLEALGQINQAKLSFQNALKDNRLSSQQVEFVRQKLSIHQG